MEEIVEEKRVADTKENICERKVAKVIESKWNDKIEELKIV